MVSYPSSVIFLYDEYNGYNDYTDIYYHDVRLSNEDILGLIRILPKANRLKKLDLSYIGVTDSQCVEELFLSLSKTNIDDLNISKFVFGSCLLLNETWDDGLRRLRNLDISRNTFDYRAQTTFINAIALSEIRKLKMAFNRIHEDEIIRFMHCVLDSKIVELEFYQTRYSKKICIDLLFSVLKQESCNRQISINGKLLHFALNANHVEKKKARICL